jgi:hypothetical protein
MPGLGAATVRERVDAKFSRPLEAAWLTLDTWTKARRNFSGSDEVPTEISCSAPTRMLTHGGSVPEVAFPLEVIAPTAYPMRS